MAQHKRPSKQAKSKSVTTPMVPLRDCLQPYGVSSGCLELRCCRARIASVESCCRYHLNRRGTQQSTRITVYHLLREQSHPSGVLKRRVLDLIVEVAALIVTDEMRADILIAGRFSGLCLMFKSTQKRLGDTLLEIDTRIFGNHLFPN